MQSPSSLRPGLTPGRQPQGLVVSHSLVRHELIIADPNHRTVSRRGPPTLAYREVHGVVPTLDSSDTSPPTLKLWKLYSNRLLIT